MIDNINEEIEVKAPRATTAYGREFSSSFDALLNAFEEYKDVNDRRLAELERFRGEDPLLNEKLERIDQELDRHQSVIDNLSLKRSRPGLSGESVDYNRFSIDALQYKAAFDAYVRKGDDDSLRRLEVKSGQQLSSAGPGGYLVTPELEDEISQRMAEISPIRSIASVKQISGSVYQKPVSTSGVTANWVAETQSRDATDVGGLQRIDIATGELYAMPAVSGTLLDDSAVDVEKWLVDEIGISFAEQEGMAFVSGNGTNRPTGFLSYMLVDNDDWSWGKLGYIVGTEEALEERLVDLVYTVKAGYRQKAVWVMNRKTQAAARKIKDKLGLYMWQPPSLVGAKASLMGFPIVEAEEMPSISNDATAIAFGDFERAYIIVDRRHGTTILRDPYTDKPYVRFYITKRVGGGIQDFDAIKFMKFSVNE